jgi:hypothetical protein
MAENLDILNAAVSLRVKAALFAARSSGRVPERDLKRLAAIDTTAVMCWGPSPNQVVVPIDHFSRKVVCHRSVDCPCDLPEPPHATGP